jgi:hypothetical protein
VKLNIPNSGTVDSAFRTLRKRLKNVRKKINIQAAHQMKGGDYSSAQKWMEVGSSITDFAARVEAFGEEWKTLTRATRIANASASERVQGNTGIKFGSAKKTPAWKFCTPALELLISTSGSMNHEQVLVGLEQSMSSILTNKDRESKTPRNPPRWQGAVKKAHKHCQREGWIEKRADGIWKITPKGRAVLAKDSKHVPEDTLGTGDSH